MPAEVPEEEPRPERHEGPHIEIEAGYEGAALHEDAPWQSGLRVATGWLITPQWSVGVAYVLWASTDVESQGTRLRLSRVGSHLEPVSPEELPPETRWVPSEIREDLLKAVGETYPLRYESLIRSYFRSLAREGVEESSALREP